MITIKYKPTSYWQRELNEKKFSDLKTKTQFCRRNNITEYEMYNNGDRVIMLNDRMVTEKTLKEKLKEISIKLIVARK